MSDLSAAYDETVASVRLGKLEQALFWYDNVPDDEPIVRYVHKMREYRQELRELGADRKSISERIAEAVAAEREACAKVALAAYIRWSKLSIKQSNPEDARVASQIAGACRNVAYGIRARGDE